MYRSLGRRRDDANRWSLRFSAGCHQRVQRIHFTVELINLVAGARQLRCHLLVLGGSLGDGPVFVLGIDSQSTQAQHRGCSQCSHRLPTCDVRGLLLKHNSLFRWIECASIPNDISWFASWLLVIAVHVKPKQSTNHDGQRLRCGLSRQANFVIEPEAQATLRAKPNILLARDEGGGSSGGRADTASDQCAFASGG